MTRTATFIDTSVLCNLLPVPGRDQDRARVLDEFRSHQDDRTQMIRTTGPR